jgi:hypothetical protein
MPISMIFLRRILPNFDLKNMVLTYTKDEAWKNWARLVRFPFFFSSQIARFYDTFQSAFFSYANICTIVTFKETLLHH